MLTNTIEYRVLKKAIACYLDIDHKRITSIVNPMRRKSLKYWLVCIKDKRTSILLKEIGDSFKRMN